MTADELLNIIEHPFDGEQGWVAEATFDLLPDHYQPGNGNVYWEEKGLHLHTILESGKGVRWFLIIKCG